MNGEISLSKRNLSGLVKGSFSQLDVKSLQVKDNFDIHSNQIKLTDSNQTSHSQVLALDTNRHITTVDKINDLAFGNVVNFESSITLPRSLPVGGSIQFPEWPSIGTTQKFLRGDGSWEALLDSEEKLPKGTISSTGTFALSDLPQIPASKVTINSVAISTPPTNATQSFLTAAGTWVQMVDSNGDLHQDKHPVSMTINTISPNTGSHITLETTGVGEYIIFKVNGNQLIELKASNTTKVAVFDAALRGSSSTPLHLESYDATNSLTINTGNTYNTQILGGLDVFGGLKLDDLPTSDPNDYGAVWLDGTVLKVSTAPR